MSATTLDGHVGGGVEEKEPSRADRYGRSRSLTVDEKAKMFLRAASFMVIMSFPLRKRLVSFASTCTNMNLCCRSLMHWSVGIQLMLEIQHVMGTRVPTPLRSFTTKLADSCIKNLCHCYLLEKHIKGGMVSLPCSVAEKRVVRSLAALIG